MNLLSHILICTLIICRCSSKLFKSRVNRYMIPIELNCPEGSLINILNMHKINADLNEVFSIVKEMTQKIIRKCSMQQTCETTLYSDHYNSSTKYELDIKYNCVEVENVTLFCQNYSKREYRGDVYLVQYALISNKDDACTCVARFSGHSYVVSLTHIPTNKKYLKVKTWKSSEKPTDRNFRDHVYQNVKVADYPKKQVFTFKNIPSETSDEDSFTLVKIEANKPSAREDESYVRLTCKKPAEYKEPGGTTKNKVLGGTTPYLIHASSTEHVVPLRSNAQLIVTFVVAISSIISIGVLTFILYRRYMKRKILKLRSMRSEGTGTDTESSQYSIYIDASERLRNSYAEIESISDYRHYICLDDISQKRLTLTVQYENGAQGRIQNSIPGVTEQQGLDTTLRREHENCSVNKPDQEYHRASAGKDSNTTSFCKDSDKSVGGSFVNICSRSTSRMISQEHYDLSGYLSLNPTERTTNASLKKWKKEIYSVEKAAREICKNRKTAAEGENSVGQRKVRIVVKPPSNKPPGYPYHYVKNQVIKCDEIEVYSKPDIDRQRSTKEDKI